MATCHPTLVWSSGGWGGTEEKVCHLLTLALMSHRSLWEKGGNSLLLGQTPSTGQGVAKAFMWLAHRMPQPAPPGEPDSSSAKSGCMGRG